MATYIADLNAHVLPKTSDDEYYIDHFDDTLTVFQTIRPEKFKVVLNVRDPDTITYEVSFSSLDMSGSTIVTHDWIGPQRTGWLFRQGWTPISAGLHTMHNTKLGDDFCTIGGKDWLGYFARRQFPFNGTPGSLTAESIGGAPYGFAYQSAGNLDIATHLNTILNKIFSKTGSWPIGYPTANGTFALAAIGKAVHLDIPLGDQTFLSDMIATLSDLSPGFDYEVTWDMLLNIASPYFFGDPTTFDVNDKTLGVWAFVFDGSTDPKTPFELEFTNTGPLATHASGYGDGSPQMAVTLGYAPGVTQFHRLDASYQFANMANRSKLDDLTRRQLAFGLNPVHEIPVSVLPSSITNFWTKFKPGRAIFIDYDLVSHQIQSGQRIVSMSIDSDNEDNGEPVVGLGLNQVYATSDSVGTPEG